DPSVRAAMLFVLGAHDVVHAREILIAELERGEPIVGLVSAMAIGYFVEPPLLPKAAEVLAEHLSDLDRVDYETFPFGSDQASDIAAALAHAADDDRTRAAKILLEHVRNQKAPLFSVVGPALKLLFQKRLEAPRLEGLTPLQREVLELVAGNAWSRLDGT